MAAAGEVPFHRNYLLVTRCHPRSLELGESNSDLELRLQ